MSPELEVAIKERVALGYSQAQITSEMHDAGYDDDTIKAVYARVTQNVAGAVGVTSAGDLIGYRALIAHSFLCLFEQWRVLAAAIVYGLALCLFLGVSMFAALEVFGLESGVAAAVVLIAVIVGLIGFFAITFALQRALLMRTQSISYFDHLTAIFPHLVGILLVSLYVQFATSLGYLLLVLPGIALSVYLLFALLVRISGTDTGAMALVRSAQLVYNRWWSVLGRTLVAGILFVCLIVPVMVVPFFIIGLTSMGDTVDVSAPLAELANPTVVMLVGLSVLIVLVGLLSLAFLMQSAMVLLYESLRATVSTYTVEQEQKLYLWMRVAVILGIPALLLLNAADYALQSETGFDSDWDTSETAPTEFEQSVSAEQAAQQAELEAFMQEFESDLQVN
jgi:hypothetical protein